MNNSRGPKSKIFNPTRKTRADSSTYKIHHEFVQTHKYKRVHLNYEQTGFITIIRSVNFN